MITVRGLDPKGMSWPQREAHRRRASVQRHASPAGAFKRHFGPAHGVELPARTSYGRQPVLFDADDGA